MISTSTRPERRRAEKALFSLAPRPCRDRATPRACAPQFSRRTLRELRRLSGLTKPKKVEKWYDAQVKLGHIGMNSDAQRGLPSLASAGLVQKTA